MVATTGRFGGGPGTDHDRSVTSPFDEPLAGRLLVAIPGMADPNFARTVVLVLQHAPDAGTLGVVLNRPSDTAVGEILPAWESLAAAPGVVFLGGPVVPSGAIGVAPAVPDVDGGVRVGDGSLITVDLERAPDDHPVPVARLRVFAGHAGWAPGQFESELADDGWFVIDADPEDPFTSDPGDLWRSVLRRAPRYKMFANFPDDPSAN